MRLLLFEDDEMVRCNDPLLYAVPLSVKADVFGVLLLQETPGGRRFRTRRSMRSHAFSRCKI